MPKGISKSLISEIEKESAENFTNKRLKTLEAEINAIYDKQNLKELK